MDVSVHISLFAFYAFLVLTARVIKVVHITQQNWGNVNYATYVIHRCYPTDLCAVLVNSFQVLTS